MMTIDEVKAAEISERLARGEVPTHRVPDDCHLHGCYDAFSSEALTEWFSRLPEFGLPGEVPVALLREAATPPPPDPEPGPGVTALRTDPVASKAIADPTPDTAPSDHRPVLPEDWKRLPEGTKVGAVWYDDTMPPARRDDSLHAMPGCPWKISFEAMGVLYKTDIIKTDRVLKVRMARLQPCGACWPTEQPGMVM